MNSLHDIEVFPYFLLGPDSFFMFVHEPVKLFIHTVLEFVLEVGLHVKDHCVDILADSLVLGCDAVHDLALLDLLFL